MKNIINAANVADNFDNAATREKVAAFYDAKALYLILSDALTEARGEEARLREEENAAQAALNDAGPSKEGYAVLTECRAAHYEMFYIASNLINATSDAYADFVSAAKAAADFDLNAAFAVYCDAEAKCAELKTAIGRAEENRRRFSRLYRNARDTRGALMRAIKECDNDSLRVALGYVEESMRDAEDNRRREDAICDDLRVTWQARREACDAAKKRYTEMRDEEESAALSSAVLSVADFNAF